MSSAERRPLKRKAEESHEQEHGRSKTAKEARTEGLDMGYTKAANIGILTLTDDDWACLDSSPPLHAKETTASISKTEENNDGSVSCGVMWRGDEGRQLDSTVSQVCLSCKREANGKKFNCGTQTFHFLPATSMTEAFALELGCKTEASKKATLASVNLKNVKVEVPEDEEYSSHPLVCCVRNCGSRSNEVDSIAFYAVPRNKELKLFWADVLDIIVPDSSCSEQYVCSLHFITPKKLPVAKTKTRKKKTCDMLVAEEAEKIKQGLSAGRPKRTPKPNKNYDWAELAPFIKTELSDTDEMEFVPVSKTQVKSTGLVGRRRKQAFTPVKKEDKENEMPSPDIRPSDFENEADEYGENVSMPSHPRAPPPKPKGRPHRIRDTCTQTDALHSSLKQPLREVKVQCNLTSEPLISCPNCSIINWTKLEELLFDCLAKIEGELCDPVLSKCLRNVVSDLQEPTHATNVLKLLCGLERDSLEGTKDIILVSSQDDEVEIENVIHPEVEAPMTGLREITPKLWQENAKWKKEIEVDVDVDVDVLGDDPDGLGLQEATEIDDDEFHPGFPEPDEEEEEDQELDDEDWNINKRDSDSGVSSSKRKQKKVNQRSKKDPGGHVLTSKVKVCLPASRPSPQRHAGTCASTGESSAHPPAVLRAEPRRGGGPNKGGASERDSTSTGAKGLYRRSGWSHTEGGSNRKGVSKSEGSTNKAHYSCDECGKVFTQRQAVRYHKVWRHNAERRGPCPYCHYKAPDPTKLRLHIKKVHRGYMPYKCKFCTKQFKCHSNHKEHEARHQGGGNFKCQFCEKKFALRSTLERHVRYHNGDRPFCCQHCGKSFKAKPHLERHVKCLHLKEKRVICKMCGAAHSNNWNLKTHMKIHQICERNPGRSCHLCSCQFKNRSGLMVHMRKTHTVIVDQPSEAAELEATVPTGSGECSLMREEEDTSQSPEQGPTGVREILPVTLPAQMTDHRTIVIHDGSQHHDQPPQLDHHLPYDELLEDSSMHTLELHSCDDCLMVFQSEDELLAHHCTHSFTTSQ